MTPSYLAILSGVVTAVIGWLVSHHLTMRRDREKFRLDSLESDLDSISEIIDDVIALSNQYHCKDRDQPLERKILTLLNRLSLRLQNLPLGPTNNKQKKQLLKQFNEFKISITGKHFEDEHNAPLDSSAEELLESYHAAIKLEEVVLSTRNLCYKPNNIIVINYWTQFEDQHIK